MGSVSHFRNCLSSIFPFQLLSWQAQLGFYFVGKELSAFLKEKFQELIGEHSASPQEVEVVMGRKLQVD